LIKELSAALTLLLFATGLENVHAMKKEEDDNNSSCYLQKLPSFVIMEIFSYLTPEELARMARVSKKFQKISENDLCWKRFGVENKKEYIDSIVFTFTNRIKTGKKYEIELAYGSSGQHETKGSQETPSINFTTCNMTLHLPVGKKTSVKFKDLPQEVQNAKYENFIGFLVSRIYSSRFITKFRWETSLPKLECKSQNPFGDPFLVVVKKSKPSFTLVGSNVTDSNRACMDTGIYISRKK
jgi:hypothetical protein